MYKERIKEKYDKFFEKYEIEDIDKFNKAQEHLMIGNVVFYGMSGKMGSGKDTIGDEIALSLNLMSNEVTKSSFAEPLRKEVDEITTSKLTPSELAELYNADQADIEKLIELIGDSNVYERSIETRKALQFWGTDVRRKQNENYWVNKLANMAIDKLSEGKSIYLTDARFPNEVQLIEDIGLGVIRLDLDEEIRMNRLKSRDGFSPNLAVMLHSSETLLDDFPFSLRLDANDTVRNLTIYAVEFLVNRSLKLNL